MTHIGTRDVKESRGLPPPRAAAPECREETALPWRWQNPQEGRGMTISA
jgi:hypothetical protein